MKKILFIIGSLRTKSFNRQVANVAKEIIGKRAEVSELDYSDLPLLNQFTTYDWLFDLCIFIVTFPFFLRISSPKKSFSSILRATWISSCFKTALIITII